MSDFETKPNTSPSTPDVAIPAVEEKPEFDKKELLAIFDEILYQGEYTETITIKGKLKVTFRTRNAKEVNEINRKIDALTVNLMSTANDLRSIENLKYALVEFHGKKLGTLKPEDRDVIIDRMPAPVIASLLTALTKFDRKIYAACNEGEENF